MAAEVNKPRVLLLGATSQIGIFAIPRLLAAGFTVTALSRKGAPDWYPRLDGLRWIEPGALREEAQPQYYGMLSAGPINLARRAVESCPGLDRAVVFSTSSVYSKAESSDLREQRQIEEILAAETELTRACSTRAVTLSLLRPTLVYGCGMDENVSRLAHWIDRFGFMPVAGPAAGRRQPVHADDLAQAAVAALSCPQPQELDTALCGGSTLSYRAMVEAIFRGLDRPVRILSLPAWLLSALCRCTGFLPGLAGVTPAMVGRQAVDLVFDDSPARESLGFAPRPFAPSRADFTVPGTGWIRRAAGQ